MEEETVTCLPTMIPQVVAVALLWLTAIVIIQLVKRVAISGVDSLGNEEGGEAKKEKLAKMFSLASIAATAIAVAALVILVLFASNPTARTSEQMGSIKGARTDKDYVAPTKDEIEAVNKDATEKKHIEKETEATEDNAKAMKDSIDMFRKAGADKKE